MKMENSFPIRTSAPFQVAELLERRSIGFQTARLGTYKVWQRWTRRMLRAVEEKVHKGEKKVTLRQIHRADRALLSGGYGEKLAPRSDPTPSPGSSRLMRS